MVCSLTNEGIFNPKLSRINVFRYSDRGINFPITCLHCDDPLCSKICPVDAISKDEHGAIVVDQSRCVGCKACMMICPFGAIIFDVYRGEVIKCNLCSGEPKCAQTCVWDAIEWIEPTLEVARKRREVIEKILYYSST